MNIKINHEQACELCGITVLRGIMKRIVIQNTPHFVCDSCCFELDSSDDVEVDASIEERTMNIKMEGENVQIRS